jgi:hypothetical protein
MHPRDYQISFYLYLLQQCKQHVHKERQVPSNATNKRLMSKWNWFLDQCTCPSNWDTLHIYSLVQKIGKNEGKMREIFAMHFAMHFAKHVGKNARNLLQHFRESSSNIVSKYNCGLNVFSKQWRHTRLQLCTQSSSQSLLLTEKVSKLKLHSCGYFGTVNKARNCTCYPWQ